MRRGIRRAVLALAGIAVAATTASAQRAQRAQPSQRGPRGQSGLVYADSGSIWVDAPAGWVLDPDAGREQGAPVVFYRKTESWQNGTSVMYVNTMHARERGLAGVVAADEADFRGRAADMQVARRAAIAIPGGRSATVRTYFSPSLHNYDAVAYIADGPRVWLLVLTARSRPDFDRAWASFRALVRSYAPGPKVRVQEGSAG